MGALKALSRLGHSLERAQGASAGPPWMEPPSVRYDGGCECIWGRQGAGDFICAHRAACPLVSTRAVA